MYYLYLCIQRTKRKEIMTLQNLIDYAKANNLNYETHTLEDGPWRKEIGIEFKPNVYYWFDVNIDETILFFRQRYNRANGAIQKSWNKGQDVRRAVISYFIKQLDK